MRLSSNTGICRDLRGGECEAEREHWYLRRFETRPQGNAGICEDLRGTTRGNTGGDREHHLGVGHLKAFFPYRQDPYSLRCLGN